jgi:hypothetical protein
MFDLSEIQPTIIIDVLCNIQKHNYKYKHLFNIFLLEVDVGVVDMH